MKKLISLLLALVMVVALAAGCSIKDDEKDEKDDTTKTTEKADKETENKDGETTAPVEEETDPSEEATVPSEGTDAPAAEGALLILENIWAQYTAEEKELYSFVGGDATSLFAKMEENPEVLPIGPGEFNLAEKEELIYQKLVPEAEIANITEAATMSNMMNGNLFTCGVYKVADADSFIAAMKNAVLGNQWMCGMPETLVIAKVDGCVLVVWGVNDSMGPFQAKFAAAYPAAELVVNEAITG